ncbi:MAG: hypothetical protein WAQ28_13680 [Bacteroidia bacterium]
MDLIIENIDLKCSGISEGIDLSFKEAIKVCLEINKHSQGKPFLIEGDIKKEYCIKWEPVTQQLFNSWLDHQVTTEFAACGIAAFIILNNTDYTIKKRSWKGTGFDYWLADKKSEQEDLFQNLAKLEVSGILNDQEGKKLPARIIKKINQIEKFQNKWKAPQAYIIVVEFSTPKSQVHLSND